MIVRRPSRGFGQTAPAESFIGEILGTGTDCSQYLTWLTNAGCWGYSPSEWATQMAYGNILPVLSKGATSVMDTSNPVSNLPTGTQEDPQGVISDAIDAQFAANQAAILAAVQAIPNSPNSPTGCTESIIPSVCDTYVYIAAVVVAGLLVFSTMKGRR